MPRRQPRNPFAGASANTRRTERALTRQRMRDYSVTTSAQSAIFGNLKSSIARQGTRLDARNQKLLDKILKHQGRMRLAERRTSNFEQDMVSQFGQEMAGTAGFLGAAPAATAHTSVLTSKAAGKNMARGAQVGQEVMGIAAQAAAMAESGAEYATAQALAARTKEDVALVAQMEHEIRMAQVQHEQALELQREQFKQDEKMLMLDQKNAEKALGNDFTGAQSATVTMAEASRNIRDWLDAGEIPQELVGPDGDTSLSVQSIMTALASPSLGVIGQEEILMPGIREVYATLINGLRNQMATRPGGQAGFDMEVDSVLNALQVHWPSWFKGKKGKKLEKWVRGSLALEYQGALLAGEIVDTDTTPSTTVAAPGGAPAGGGKFGGAAGLG